VVSVRRLLLARYCTRRSWSFRAICSFFFPIPASVPSPLEFEYFHLNGRPIQNDTLTGDNEASPRST
jgi:hypothetical protein